MSADRGRILYNFPAVSSGIDVDSDLVVSVVRASPNVCAIKLTCANVGKLTRILAETGDRAFVAEYPRSHGQGPFAVIDGFIDFLLPSVAVGAAGAISGLPNIAPVRHLPRLDSVCACADRGLARVRQALDAVPGARYARGA